MTQSPLKAPPVLTPTVGEDSPVRSQRDTSVHFLQVLRLWGTPQQTHTPRDAVVPSGLRIIAWRDGSRPNGGHLEEAGFGPRENQTFQQAALQLWTQQACGCRST